ncbi:hypothetical protein QR680_010316 [Steinernema hermaphroditum]|uniref:Uncharacterized protein n=1 Tax=Steinernema hermaphroditum TaxID=289476 RepID=A0AA39INJ6_9BILA|nr:hypothetical protein QR680_010316 [Steinernema hermaphroditum]
MLLCQSDNFIGITEDALTMVSKDRHLKIFREDGKTLELRLPSGTRGSNRDKGDPQADPQLTWADIRVADTLFRYDIIGKNLKDECLATKAFVHRIHDLPELREYVKNRDLSRNF